MVEACVKQWGTGLSLSIDYDSPTALRRFLDERGFGMQKKFGQNFLINRNARERLVDALGAEPGETVWEVGPGLGAMTAILLERGLSMTAFEIDRGFAAALRECFGELDSFRLVEGDALKTWPVEQRERGLGRYFFGNLPYNIAAVLIASFIESGAYFDRAVVTVQKEVAKRMAAKAGDEDYSSFSVLCASAYAVRPLLTLKPASFYPAPNVDSAAVAMDRLSASAPGAASRYFRPLVRALFSSRRKTVRNNLETFASAALGSAAPGAKPSASGELAAAALSAAGIDGKLRAERLSFEEFAALAAAFESLIAGVAKP